MTEERLALLQVHAHPDDEASKGAGTTAKYAAEGVHNVLVCCTGGEAGDILNPAVEHPGSPEAMYELRMAELRESVRVLGYSSLRLLGYRDSGMPDTEENARPDNFANAPLDEAEAYPDAGEPWQPLKLYFVSWSIARVKALHEAYLRRGEESVYASWFERGFDKDRTDDFTTLIDVGDYLAKRRASLLAHRTQVDPDGHWMRLPDNVIREVFPWEEFTLARSLVDNRVPEGEFEDDLFAGVRERVQQQ